MKKNCEFCNKEFEAYKNKMKFCSKSCAISYRNIKAVENGTHNFIQPGYHEYVLSCQIKNGTHPFMNMSEEAKLRKAEGISLARKEEAKNGTHIWQRPEIRINNEYSRSLTIIERDKLELLDLYYSDCEIPNCFKIGWSRNSDFRWIDNRTHDLTNITKIITRDALFIVNLERDIKQKFLDLEFFNKYRTTEIFPNSKLEEILQFINSKI